MSSEITVSIQLNKQQAESYLRFLVRQYEQSMRDYWFADSYKDIAEFVGLSEKNVSVRLTRIRQKMKSYLAEREVFV